MSNFGENLNEVFIHHQSITVYRGGIKMLGSAFLAWIGFTWSAAMMFIATIFAFLS